MIGSSSNLDDRVVRLTMSQGFGGRLAFARKRKGLAQAELAKLTAYSGGYISRLEKESESSPPLDTVIRFAAALDVPVGFLAGEPCPVTGAGGATPGELFAEHLRTLSTEARTQLSIAELEVRFAKAVTWLCDRYPYVFTIATLTHNLGLSRLDAIVAGHEHLSGLEAVQELSRRSGIPLQYFGGEFDRLLSRESASEAYACYEEAVQKAVSAGISPVKLSKLIDLIRECSNGAEAAALFDLVRS